MGSVLAANLGVNDRRESGAWLVRVVQHNKNPPVHLQAPGDSLFTIKPSA